MNLKKSQIKIPKKYEYMIEKIQIKSMEYIAILKDEYESSEMPNQKIISAFTMEDFLKKIRKLKRKEE